MAGAGAVDGDDKTVQNMISYTEDQELLRETVRRYLADRAPESVVREMMETDTGFDREAWKVLAAELGLQGVAIPAKHGGLGLGQIELCIVFEEMGRSLLCAPFFSTIALAANMLLALGDEKVCSAYLPRIVSGDLIATVAACETGPVWEPADDRVQASQSSTGWTLSGKKRFVVDGAAADLLLVVAKAPFGHAVFTVEQNSPGMAVTALSTLDQTRKLSDLVFDNVNASLIGGLTDRTPQICRAFTLASLALVAEQLGGAQRVLEMAVDYANERVQFGRLIGSFQAIKHKCADMLMEIESSRAAASEAYRLAALGDPNLEIAVSIAKAYCSESYFKASSENIQIHGGIGFTWDHPAHLYFKRAKASEILLGDGRYHRERYLRHSRIFD